MTRDAGGVVTGNTYDKYGSSNPLVRRMMAGFESSLDEMFEKADPQSILDIGCGEGVLTQKWAMRLHPKRVVGIDLEDTVIQAEWAKREAPNLDYRIMKAESLPFANDEFDVTTAIEVLEHVDDPDQVVAEMARVAARWMILSAPREPLWRGLNMVRGAYIRDLGNTPGHLNHWSKRAFVRLIAQHGEVVEARSPFPWTMLLVRVGG